MTYGIRGDQFCREDFLFETIVSFNRICSTRRVYEPQNDFFGTPYISYKGTNYEML
jgi:hypothetical protein